MFLVTEVVPVSEGCQADEEVGPIQRGMLTSPVTGVGPVPRGMLTSPVTEVDPVPRGMLTSSVTEVGPVPRGMSTSPVTEVVHGLKKALAEVATVPVT